MSHLCPPYKKSELLSPAGDMECFFAAVENGADAVYFGLKDFSARAGADNFTIDDASKAIAYARKMSVRVYIAINTLIKTNEMDKVVDCLIALDELQPDALIIQDLGLLYLIQSQFPQFTLHASTQMTIHNLAGVKELERMGFKRVVLSRELSVDEIKNIAQNSNMETEVFVHGALCYSYSGLCFFSSMMGGRSGNRGRCAQPCRMYYKSQPGEAGYLFSMKDLRTLPHIKELMDAGIHSFKIEGRMKSPEYVAVVTHVYRQAIDGKLEDMDDAIRLMNTVFSRETTHSYLFDKSYQRSKKNIDNNQIKAADMINPAYPANIGSYAGEVIKSEKGYIKIRADAEIGVRDLLQVFENSSEEPSLLHVKNIKVNGKRVFGIKAGDIAMIDTESQYKKGARLYLLSSQKIKEDFAPKVPRKLVTSKIPVDLEIKIKPEGIGIKGTTRHFSFSRDFSVKLEKGIHRTIETQNIKECFSRLGETLFELAGIHTEISGELFVPLSVLNEIRRDYFQIFCEEWRKDKENRSENIRKWIKGKIVEFTNPMYGNSGWRLTNKGCHEQPPLFPFNKGGQRGSSATDLISKSSAKDVSGDGVRLSLKVDKPDYLNHIPLENIYKIYIVLTDENVKNLTKKAGGTPPNSPPLQGGDGGVEGLFSDEACNQLMRGKDKVVFSLPAIMRDMGTGYMTYGYFKKVVHELISQGFRQFQISNLGAMGLFEGEDVLVYADYPLYCLNPLSAMKLMELGFCRHTLSPEDDKENLEKLFSPNSDVIIYYDTPLFTSETCIWANMKRTCPGKNLCGFKQMIVENEYGDRFVTINEECKTVVINQKPFSITHLIPKLLEAGQKDFRIDLCYKDYTPEMINDIFLKIQDKSKVKNSMIGNFERGLL
ncbi:MAG TPA: peptidase U32 family protein [Candidatus Wunengus sp. YC60]|uniref:peptidase U32 family protein n=1 Tax=Candidatus Wunengus sp. YC60 TaxID=3367697 RepID=UPI0040272728